MLFFKYHMTIQWGMYYYTQFIDEETKIQRG